MALHLWDLLPKTHDPVQSWREHQDYFQLRKIVQISKPISLKMFKFIKNKKSLRNFHSQEEPKEIAHLNIMWYPEWVSAKDKSIRYELRTSESSVAFSLINNVIILVYCHQCAILS